AAAVAAASGARVSGRLVAGLPIAFLVLMPFRRVEMLDRADLYLVLAGVGLAVAGMRWIDKLVPDPQGFDDPLLSFVSNIERSIGAGLGIRTALSTSTERSTDERLRVVAALVSAGATWHVALQRSPDPFLRALAPIVSRAERLGTPVAFEIDRLLVARRDELARLFDIQLRRAPVLMMVPLTLCVLPAYALLAFGPFLRGLGIPMG
ncbi:MAG TPA: type II secretion system F family protein, partial [Actinomycetota bacterium]|nr:type II secretion system F family protein [Actinomycetota bacterium]